MATLCADVLQSPPGHLLGLRPSPDKLQLGLSRLRSVSLGSGDLGHVDPGAFAAWCALRPLHPKSPLWSPSPRRNLATASSSPQ